MQRSWSLKLETSEQKREIYFIIYYFLHSWFVVLKVLPHMHLTASVLTYAMVPQHYKESLIFLLVLTGLDWYALSSVYFGVWKNHYIQKGITVQCSIIYM